MPIIVVTIFHYLSISTLKNNQAVTSIILKSLLETMQPNRVNSVKSHTSLMPIQVKPWLHPRFKDLAKAITISRKLTIKGIHLNKSLSAMLLS